MKVDFQVVNKDNELMYEYGSYLCADNPAIPGFGDSIVEVLVDAFTEARDKDGIVLYPGDTIHVITRNE